MWIIVSATGKGNPNNVRTYLLNKMTPALRPIHIPT